MVNSSPSKTADTQSRVLVESLLHQLTPDYRATLVLRELEGLDYCEIAAIVHIPVGRVRWRLHQARAQFRKLCLAASEETSHD